MTEQEARLLYREVTKLMLEVPYESEAYHLLLARASEAWEWIRRWESEHADV